MRNGELTPKGAKIHRVIEILAYLTLLYINTVSYTHLLTVTKQTQNITHFVIAGYLFVETVTVLIQACTFTIYSVFQAGKMCIRDRRTPSCDIETLLFVWLPCLCIQSSPPLQEGPVFRHCLLYTSLC